MIDVVERLRTTAEMFELAHAPRHTVLHMRAAADEIERLRAALDRAADRFFDAGMNDYWAEARAELAQEARDER